MLWRGTEPAKVISTEVPQPDNNLQHVAPTTIFGLAQYLNSMLAQVLELGALSITIGICKLQPTASFAPQPHGSASNNGRRRTGTKDGHVHTELRFSCCTMAPYVFKPMVVWVPTLLRCSTRFPGASCMVQP